MHLNCEQIQPTDSTATLTYSLVLVFCLHSPICKTEIISETMQVTIH